MMNTYEKTIQDNLSRLYQDLPENLDQILPAKRQGEKFALKAFGESCIIQPGAIFIGDAKESGALGILISLYALHANADPCIAAPFKAFREFPNSMPYAGAFATHTENILIPHIEKIEHGINRIEETLGGEIGTADNVAVANNVAAANKVADAIKVGDFSFCVCPLPKIMLNYIFYRADDEFPAAASCLYSNNAHAFLPIDALADTGEYTSKKIIDLVM
jgi:hypothetical protein